MTARPEILCLGAAHWDVIGHSPAPVAIGADLPGTVRMHPGGVALNIACGLAAQGCRTALLSVIGRDRDGDALLARLSHARVQTDHLHRPENLPTGRYLAIEGPEGLVAAIADNATLEASGLAILAPLLCGALRNWAGPVVFDSGMRSAALAEIGAAAQGRLQLRLVASSAAKIHRLLPILAQAECVYLNRSEAETLLGRAFLDTTEAVEALIAKGARRALVTDGAAPASDGDAAQVITRTPAPIRAARVTGAGDALIAAHIAAELRGAPRAVALEAALDAAAVHISCL